MGEHDKAIKDFSKVLSLQPKEDILRQRMDDLLAKDIKGIDKTALESFYKQELEKLKAFKEQVYFFRGGCV